jgi:uncharacterized protein YdaU (DUF1376 family)
VREGNNAGKQYHSGRGDASPRPRLRPMMNGLPYYPRYPRDFFDGTNGMTFELKGAYAMLLDLIYMCGGQLYDEPRFIAGHMNCSVRAWGGYRAALIERGKIRVEDGIISNFRADKELIIQRSFQDKQRINASQPRKIKDLTEATAQPKPSHTDTDTEVYKRETKVSRASSEVEGCITHFNEVAERVGWAQVQRVTTARKAALIHRMEDCGGADAWCVAMDRAARSPLLTGQTGRGWRADFDWLCKAANFTKLMEGNYDPRPNGAAQSAHQPGAGGAHDSMVAAFAYVASREPH